MASLMDIFDEKKQRHLCRKNALTTSRQKLHKLFFAEERLICPKENKSAFRF